MHEFSDHRGKAHMQSEKYFITHHFILQIDHACSCRVNKAEKHTNQSLLDSRLTESA